jgi:hypothetical protein
MGSDEGLKCAKLTREDKVANLPYQSGRAKVAAKAVSF